jgi:hypothetical protein
MAGERPVDTLTLHAQPLLLDDGTTLVPVRPSVYTVVGLPSGYKSGMFRRDLRWTVLLSHSHRHLMWGEYETPEEALRALQSKLPQ